MTLRWVVWLILGSAALAVTSGGAQQPPDGFGDSAKSQLLAAYPDRLQGIDGGMLVWRDGTRMPLDDGRGPKSFADWLAAPDIKDMFAEPYSVGAMAGPPAKDQDPGRARNAAFFDKMYGNCRKGEVEANLTDVVWLPHKKGQHLKVTKLNGVAAHLAAAHLRIRGAT